MDTQVVLNYALSLLGFLGIIGTLIGFPTGIVLLVTSSSQKDEKAKKRRVLWGVLAIVVPPAIILFTLVAYAVVNTVMSSIPAAGTY